jgi:D-alanyl-lipoteichoic acid acyltransferase DltB (MBOAT superfamily)
MEFLKVTPYSGLFFWVLLVFFVIGCMLFRRATHRALRRNLFMIVSSLLVLGLSQVNAEYGAFFIVLFLVALSCAVYSTGTMLLSSQSRAARIRIAALLIFLLIAVLSYYKYSLFQQFVSGILLNLSASAAAFARPASQHIFFIGISYFTFKFIHFLVDCYNRKVKEISFLTFLNYIFFFPSFFVGPINRYNSFHESIAVAPATVFRSDLLYGGKRIVNGLFKQMIGRQLLPFSIAAIDFTSPEMSIFRAVGGIYCYMFYVYLDFSGYSDMAIGSGRLVGIRLPENFNYPLFRRNLQQFWANWHMSLTSWLTDYVYWPLARRFRHVAALRSKPVLMSCICIFLTFVACGFWHGDGLNFILWGSYHGFGLALLNAYTQFEKKKLPVAWRKFVNNSRWGYGFSWFVTFQYAAFGFLLFGADMHKLGKFFHLLSNYRGV